MKYVVCVCCVVVTGEKERGANTVNIRTRDGTVHGTKPVTDFLMELVAENDQHFKY